MKYARRRDENERPIVQALERVGATVTRMDAAGVPDLLVGFRGETFLLEVKLPLGPQGGVHHNGDGARDMTAAQVAWWGRWTGRKAVVVRSVEDALRAIGAMP